MLHKFEEKVGDLHSFRKNLILISIINLLVITFGSDIGNINFLVFKLDNIDDWKIYTLLFGGNIYALWRYWQYLTISPIYKNNKFTFKEVIKLNKEKRDYIGIPSGIQKIDLDEQWNLIEYRNNDNIGRVRFRDIIKNNIYVVINKSEERKHGKKTYDSVISFSEENINKDNLTHLYHIAYNSADINDNFLFKDKYFADRNLPLIIGVFSTICLLIKLLSYIC